MGFLKITLKASLAQWVNHKQQSPYSASLHGTPSRYKSVPYVAKYRICASSCCIVYLSSRYWQNQHLHLFGKLQYLTLMLHPRSCTVGLLLLTPPQPVVVQYQIPLYLLNPHCHGDSRVHPMVNLKIINSHYRTSFSLLSKSLFF